jgi:hypothetical protein
MSTHPQVWRRHMLADGGGGPRDEPRRRRIGLGRLQAHRAVRSDRGRLRCVDARRHTLEIVSPKRAIGGIRSEHRHVGHLIAKPKAAYAITQLIDFVRRHNEQQQQFRN